jgi:hypothetical protein
MDISPVLNRDEAHINDKVSCVLKPWLWAQAPWATTWCLQPIIGAPDPPEKPRNLPLECIGSSTRLPKDLIRHLSQDGSGSESNQIPPLEGLANPPIGMSISLRNWTTQQT